MARLMTVYRMSSCGIPLEKTYSSVRQSQLVQSVSAHLTHLSMSARLTHTLRTARGPGVRGRRCWRQTRPGHRVSGPCAGRDPQLPLLTYLDQFLLQTSTQPLSIVGLSADSHRVSSHRQLLRMSSGVLVLVAGRPGLGLWLGNPGGTEWQVGRGFGLEWLNSPVPSYRLSFYCSTLRWNYMIV